MATSRASLRHVHACMPSLVSDALAPCSNMSVWHAWYVAALFSTSLSISLLMKSWTLIVSSFMFSAMMSKTMRATPEVDMHFVVDVCSTVDTHFVVDVFSTVHAHLMVDVFATVDMHFVVDVCSTVDTHFVVDVFDQP